MIPLENTGYWKICIISFTDIYQIYLGNINFNIRVGSTISNILNWKWALLKEYLLVTLLDFKIYSFAEALRDDIQAVYMLKAVMCYKSKMLNSVERQLRFFSP